MLGKARNRASWTSQHFLKLKKVSLVLFAHIVVPEQVLCNLSVRTRRFTFPHLHSPDKIQNRNSLEQRSDGSNMHKSTAQGCVPVLLLRRLSKD